MGIAIALLALGNLAGPGTPDDQAPEPARFLAPERLMAGSAPMGEALMYPSPALFDLDGDGATELILGCLSGNLYVSKRAAEGGASAWGPTQPLLGADGKQLKFSNW